jgi:signal transduction histidine kinase
MLRYFSVIIYLVVLFVSFSALGQTDCNAFEVQINRIIANDASEYQSLISQLKACEFGHRIGKGYSRVLYHEARMRLNNGEIEEADKLIRQGLNQQKDQKTIIDLKLLKSASYFLKNQLEQSIKISNELIATEHISANQLAKAYQYLSGCHSRLGNRHYQYVSLVKSVRQAQKCNDSTILSSCYNNLGVYYRSESSKYLRRSLFYFRKALDHTSELDISNKSRFLINLGTTYEDLNVQEKAQAVYLEVWNSYSDQLDSEMIFDLTTNLGNFYLVKGEINRATYFYDIALEKYKELPEKTLDEINIYFNLNELEYSKGNVAKSREYLRTYMQLYQKILEKENNNKILEMQERFNSKARQAQILSLKTRNQASKLRNYYLQNILLISAILLVIAIISYSYFTRKRQLAEKIRVKNEIKRASLEATENEKLRFSRDLHDSLGGNLTVVGLLVSQAQERNPDQKKAFEDLYQIVQSSITDLRRVCRDLYPSEILISGVVSSIGFHFEKLTSLHPSVSFDFKADEVKLEKGFSVNLYRIIQELTNNSLKYAESTAIQTKISVSNDALIIDYKDNGKGIDPKNLTKGVGLNSIEERAKAYKGSMSIQTAPGSGFGVKLTFPLEDILLNE